MNVDNGQSNIFKKKTTKKPPPKIKGKNWKKKIPTHSFLGKLSLSPSSTTDFPN